MKRFASLATTAALAGSLVAAGTAAHAVSAIYLVPVSDMGVTYAPGAVIQFSAVVDIGIGTFGSLSAPAAVGYFTSQFGPAKPSAKYDQSDFVLNPGNPFWDTNAPLGKSYATTATGPGGVKLNTFQAASGHTAVQNATGDATLAVPVGTYTIATFSFPISASFTGSSVTVLLPTPAGYSSSALTTDGSYISGVGPSMTLSGKDVLGVPISDVLTFPNTGGKFSSLTFKTAPAPSSLLVVAMGAIPAIGVLRRRRATK